MKRQIRASRKDDLIREQQQWKMRHDARQVLYNEQEGRYDKARWDWKDSVVDLIKKQFSSYISKLPYLEINVDDGWRRTEVRFKYADYLGSDDRANVSLRWSYTIYLTENGQIEKETNSWSGFEAVTPEQIDDLMNSANFLKAIVDFDWAPLLNEAKASVPKYSQYVGVRDPNHDPDYKDPGYDKMIKEAELDEALNSDMWIKAQGSFGYDKWVYIVSQTPKFYNIISLDDYQITHATESNSNLAQLNSMISNPKDASPYYLNRIKKDALKVTTPVETISPRDLVARIGTAVR